MNKTALTLKELAFWSGNGSGKWNREVYKLLSQKGKVREDHRTNIKKQSPMRAGGSKTGKLQEEGGMCAGP